MQLTAQIFCSSNISAKSKRGNKNILGEKFDARLFNLSTEQLKFN